MAETRKGREKVSRQGFGFGAAGDGSVAGRGSTRPAPPCFTRFAQPTQDLYAAHPQATPHPAHSAQTSFGSSFGSSMGFGLHGKPVPHSQHGWSIAGARLSALCVRRG